jgi:hypothetical protein
MLGGSLGVFSIRVGCSFAASTLVLLEHGKTKPIKKIRPGDRVEAGDADTGKNSGARTVTATFVNHDDDLIDLTVRVQGGKTATLHTTSKHPFWDDTKKAWVSAGKLKPGHLLNTVRNRHVVLVAVRVRPGEAPMYNLTVAGLHTYYVLAGNTSILVHNTCNPGEAEVSKLPKDWDRRTRGILDVGAEQIPMSSGPDGQSHLLEILPGRTAQNFDHVETHAAAFLRMNPGITKAVLYLDNKFGMCPGPNGCGARMEDMLPEGVQVWVSSSGKKYGPFTGNAN